MVIAARYDDARTRGINMTMPVRKTKPQKGDKQYGHSAITNGTTLLPGIDGRSPWVRRCKDIIEIHINDLGEPNNASAAELSLIRRIAVLTVELEMIEVKFANATARADDLDLYQRTAGNLRRLLEAIQSGTGLPRRPREITPSLSDYLKESEIIG
jgi:hypothetical protein